MVVQQRLVTVEAFEIKSPKDTFKGLRAKAEYDLANGARLVWLVYPDERLVEVFRLDADSRLLNEQQMLDGGDVLPGFQIAVKAIFRGL